MTTSLPAWLADSLKNENIATPATISVLGNKVYVRAANEYVSEHFSVDEAYDSAREAGFEIIFDMSVDKFGGELSDDNNWFVVEDTKRLLSSYPFADRVKDLEETYQEWLDEIVPTYEAAPDVFINAYNFIAHHPAFWLRSPSIPAHWETDFGAAQVAVNAYVREGEVVILLETGSHIAPDYTSRYLDMDIVSHAPTFEEAYVLLASKVFKNYNLDGSD